MTNWSKTSEWWLVRLADRPLAVCLSVTTVTGPHKQMLIGLRMDRPLLVVVAHNGSTVPRHTGPWLTPFWLTPFHMPHNLNLLSTNHRLWPAQPIVHCLRLNKGRKKDVTKFLSKTLQSKSTSWLKVQIPYQHPEIGRGYGYITSIKSPCISKTLVQVTCFDVLDNFYFNSCLYCPLSLEHTGSGERQFWFYSSQQLCLGHSHNGTEHMTWRRLNTAKLRRPKECQSHCTDWERRKYPPEHITDNMTME